MHSDDVFKTLERVTKISEKLLVPYEQIKPCVIKIMKGLPKGSFPNRVTGGLIIASELRRIGLSKEKVSDVVIDWNTKNQPPLPISKIASIVRSSYKREYKYSCNNENLKVNCVGKSFCSFHKAFSKHRKYYNNRVFLDLGWQMFLSNSAKSVYYISLLELERRLGVGAGGRIITNYRKIAYFSGVSIKIIKKALTELNNKGLLTELRIGSRKRHGRIGTQIRRKIPIPTPSVELLEKKEKYH